MLKKKTEYEQIMNKNILIYTIEQIYTCNIGNNYILYNIEINKLKIFTI